MKRQTIYLFAFAALAIIAKSGNDFKDCDGKINEWPVIDQPPQLLATAPNGKKFMINGTQEQNSIVYLAIVKGSPFEAGKAYGGLFQKEINENIDNMFTYMDDLIRDLIKEKLPKKYHWLVDLPIKELVEVALSSEFIDTGIFTPARYEEEIYGMAEGSGATFAQITMINMLPELTRAQCSIIGAWGPATPSGDLVQVRALDWQPNAPLNKYPVISIYHFSEEGSQPFANFGWAGLVGSLAGMSSKVAVAEKDWWPVIKNETTPFGTPWMYLLRDVLQFDTNIDQAIKRLGEAHRTWKLFLGVGSVEDKRMAGIEYAQKVFNVYTDKNFTTPYPNSHPLMDGVIFWDKWAQPSRHKCLGSILQEGYGELTPEYMFKFATALGETGNALVAVYDFENMVTYLAYSEYAKSVNAYERPVFKLNLTELFNIEV